jgi:hypothetical protein
MLTIHSIPSPLVFLLAISPKYCPLARSLQRSTMRSFVSLLAVSLASARSDNTAASPEGGIRPSFTDSAAESTPSPADTGIKIEAIFSSTWDKSDWISDVTSRYSDADLTFVPSDQRPDNATAPNVTPGELAAPV